MRKIAGIMAIIMVLAMIFGGCTNNEIAEENNRQNVANNSPEPREPVMLAEFSTPLNDKDEERVDNIKLACEAISGTKLKSGEEFSFNSIVGERTPEKGYQEAKIFVGDELDEGYGGGICQISSTIYQAALAAGFDVTERHEHEREVSYIELGNDATVSYGSQDLRFINTHNGTVEIEASVDESQVYVKISTI